MGEAKINVTSEGILTHIEIDGQPVKARAFTFHSEAGKIPVMTVDYICPNLDLETRIVPNLPEVLKPFYTSDDDICVMFNVSMEDLKARKALLEMKRDCQQ